MPSVGCDTPIVYANDLARHYGFRQITNNGVAPSLATAPSGRQGVLLKLADAAVVQSRSAMRHTIKYMRDGDESAPTAGIQNIGIVDCVWEFEYESTAGLWTGGVRDMVCALYAAGDVTFVNIQFSSATQIRVFMTGQVAALVTIPGGINVSTGVHTLRVYYAKSGIAGVTPALRVWIDGQEVTLPAGFTNHVRTENISTYDFTTRNEVAALSAGQAPGKWLYKHWVRAGRVANPAAAFDFSAWSPGGKPPGLAHWADVVHDQAKMIVSEFPGRLGYAETWSRVLWAIGDTWPGDGSANTTAALEHTVGSLYFAHHAIPFGAPADPAHKVMAKVVIQDAESAPANSWTSGIYEVKPVGSAPGDANLARPIDILLGYCMKGYGRGVPDWWRVVGQAIDPARDTIGALIEDELYSDDREPDTADALTYPQDANAPPDYGSAMPAGSGLGVAVSQRMLWESASFSDLFARIPAWRLSGVSDHVWDNSWVPGWAGDGAEVGGEWGTMTRGEMHNRGNDFLAKVYQPGLIGAPAQGADPYPPMYSAKQTGPILHVALDPYRYANVNGTKLGATQLAWLRNLCQTTTAKHVVLYSPQPMFDAVYKPLQDWHDRATWRGERDTILDDLEANASVQSVIVYVGDAHLPWWYPTPSATHPKVLGEFAGGSLSSTMLIALAARPNLASIEAVVTADGRPGWVGPAAGGPGLTTGGELQDQRHQRRTGRARYGVDGSLTLELFNADFDPDDPPSDLDSTLLRTVSLNAFTPTSDTPSQPSIGGAFALVPASVLGEAPGTAWVKPYPDPLRAGVVLAAAPSNADPLGLRVASAPDDAIDLDPGAVIDLGSIDASTIELRASEGDRALLLARTGSQPATRSRTR
jgi:hypothetical protein